MAFDSDTCIKLFTAVAAIEIIGILSIQDWDYKCVLCFPTAGRADKSWGTYVTMYIQGFEALVMVFLAPWVDKLLTNAFKVSFGLEAVACFCSAIGHHLFVENDRVWQNLLLVSFLGISYAGLLRVFVATAAAKRAGHLRLLPDQRDLVWIFAVLGGVFLAVLLVAVYHHTQLPDWMLTIAKQLVTAVALVLVGFFADQFQWALAIGLTYGAAFALDYVNLKPIIYNTSANNTALYHSLLVLYLVANFGLLTGLMRNQTTFHQLSSVGDSFANRVDDAFPFKGGHPNPGNDRACCDCGGLRGK